MQKVKSNIEFKIKVHKTNTLFEYELIKVTGDLYFVEKYEWYFTIHNNCEGTYTISDFLTGMKISTGTTKTQAVQEMKQTIKKVCKEKNDSFSNLLKIVYKKEKCINLTPQFP